MNVGGEFPSPFARTVALHSLTWLVLANLVGMWLGVCLIWPHAGNLIAPLTFGRWAPLHLDWQLYGWCSLPLVGALIAWYFDPAHPRGPVHARIALAGWSLALALGGVAWLGGTTSGKLFLDWHGWTRPLLPLAMHILWAFLAVHTWWRLPRLTAAARIARIVLLMPLLAIPTVLQWSAGRNVQPSVNPDSGGSTGASLLGSTLAIVTIYLLLPVLLGFTSRRRNAPFVWALAASWLVFALIDRGHASHHSPAQIAGLGVLLAWIPLLPWSWSGKRWPPPSRPWLAAAAVWWTALVLSGWLTFLPGISERLKFTHALVGHAHLAMAGLVTSVNGAILVSLSNRPAPRATFWLWQSGGAVFVIAMLALGWQESTRLAELFRSEPWTQGWLLLRLAAGGAMTFASAWWLSDALRR